MPITPVDVQTQIILEVGDVNPQTGDPATTPGQPGSDGIIYGRINYLWDRYAAWDTVGAGLREMHCRAAAIRLVLGVLNPRRFDHSDTRGGLSVRADQLWQHYKAMLDQVTDDIATAKAAVGIGTPAGLGVSGPYQSGRLVYRAPLPAQAAPDPNDPRYGGMVPQAAPMPPGRIDDQVT